MSSIQALNRLAKWRTLFAGWQLGTRPKGDPECDAVRDHRELTILLRVETTALTGLMLRKGLITAEEFDSALEDEANRLNVDYSKKFPGVTATHNGLVLDPRKIDQSGWMKDWKP